jgi:hypothetical protein
MNKIKLTDTIPTAPGLYIANFFNGQELVRIVLQDGELYNVNGARTHFSRWQCKWSAPIELE